MRLLSPGKLAESEDVETSVFEGRNPAFLGLVLLLAVLWRHLLHLHGSQWSEQKLRLFSGDSEVCSKPRHDDRGPVLVPHEGGTWFA